MVFLSLGGLIFRGCLNADEKGLKKLGGLTNGIGLIVIGLLMFTLQFSTSAVCCGDWDGYYHIRWSALLWENLSQFKGLPQFQWLPLTVLNPDGYADHHFLFHLLQIPFLWFFEPVMAAKVAAVFYGTLAIFSVYWLMFRYRVDYLLIWLAALLTCANPFWYRMNMAKAPRGVPTIVGWTKRRDGGVTGKIYGSPNFNDGERVETSPITSGDTVEYYIYDACRRTDFSANDRSCATPHLQ